MVTAMYHMSTKGIGNLEGGSDVTSKLTKWLVLIDFEKKNSFFVLLLLKIFQHELNHELNQFSTDLLGHLLI